MATPIDCKAKTADYDAWVDCLNIETAGLVVNPELPDYNPDLPEFVGLALFQRVAARSQACRFG